MITIEDVINFILSTDDLTALPTVMDAITQRMASELGMSANMPQEPEMVEEDTEVAPEDNQQAVYF